MATGWHSTLGVTPWASYEEIRAAFKRRVLETHPDKGGRACDFRQVMLAFEEASVASTMPAKVSWKGRFPASAKKRRNPGVFQRDPKAKTRKRGNRAAKRKGRTTGSGRNALIQRLHSYLRQLQRDDRSWVSLFASNAFSSRCFCELVSNSVGAHDIT
eukprot:Skav231811  [mRNA]  locus=scaffold692:298985:299458:- [translate_table: standard]